ncbi:MAG: glycosyltransferase family 39 protein, partial [Candidatus Woesebacteria bacterium]|nr:glycosyltransferase family 39 protein [Candidatus Woesebacteria bacterium]
LVIIFAFAALVRFYNFPNRVTFWSEQARSLIVSADYLKKPSLLGQSYFVREDTNSHVLYAGAMFNYSLIPLLLISNYDPIVITVFFTLLNLFTGLVIYLVVKKIFSREIAIVSCMLFLFNDWMIYHSLFIWIYNLLPLLGILILYFIRQYFKNRKSSGIFILGLLSGFGVSLQFLFLPIALAVYVILLLGSRRKIIDTILFIFGMTLGNLPMIIFDLRHNFYESRTLIQYFLDTLAGRSNAAIAYYYFLPFWPILAIIGGLVIFRIWKKSRFLSVLIVILYLVLNLTSNRINWKIPTGMPAGLTAKDIDYSSKMIAGDINGNFNVSEVLDFDKRAYVLRYFVEYKYGKKPLDEVSYQNLQTLYVLAQKDYDFNKSDVWEITAGGPYKISHFFDVGQGYSIFKLTR